MITGCEVHSFDSNHHNILLMLKLCRLSIVANVSSPADRQIMGSCRYTEELQ